MKTYNTTTVSYTYVTIEDEGGLDIIRVRKS
jgi:hypothetical protein